MKFHLFPVLFLLGTVVTAQSQQNMRLLANVNPPGICNDIWGYVDPGSGAEYAVMGGQTATLIYSLDTPAKPVLVASIPGSPSTWRDIKQYRHYLYVTTGEGGDGLLIINMSGAPDSISHHFWKSTLTIGSFTRELDRCHNLYIDTAVGQAYLSGCNIGGVVILDLRSDPGEPVFLGAANERYSHDNFASGNLLYSAEVWQGEFSIYDISDPASPVVVGRHPSSYRFTHNIWPSDDGKTLFTTDESSNAFVDAYDISDLQNILYLDSYRPEHPEGQGSTPHNTHYHEGYLITSWYTDGIRIIDAHQPDNLIEVGHYDTDTVHTRGFEGCWGAFPFLPSGLVLASDRQSGLFVFEADYQRACYLEGIVTNSATNTAINNVEVIIKGVANQESMTGISGIYKTGTSNPGSYQVVYRKEGYLPDTLEVSLSAGETTVQNVMLQPLATFGGRVIQRSNGAGVSGAQVAIYNEQLDLAFDISCDSLGYFNMPTFVPENYTMVAGKWGFLHTSSHRQINPNDRIVLILEQGYQDDFIFDQQWQISGDALDGAWEGGRPNGVSFNGGFSNPNTDAGDDLGHSAYITGNEGRSVMDDDVDFGETVLISPLMDLQNYDNPVLQFQYWFYNRIQAGPAEDTLKVMVSNGQDTVVLEKIYASVADWLPSSGIPIKEYIDLSDQMQVFFSTRELVNESLIEAGIDAFLITEQAVTEVREPDTPNAFQAYPNPFLNGFNLKWKVAYPEPVTIEIFNSLGQLLWEKTSISLPETIRVGEAWNPGLYYIRFKVGEQTIATQKIVKL